MFKNLRDRLNKVSSKLEDELEAKLEAELEAQLAAEMGGEPAPVEEAKPEPVPEPAPEPAPAPAEPEPEPVPEPKPAPVPQPAPEPTPEVKPEPAPQPDPQREPQQAPQREPAPQPQPTKAPETAPSTPKPVEAPSVAPQPAPQAKPVEQEKPKEVITGRKRLTEEEIAARLAKELDEAVEIQKEVETVVAESTPRLNRYTINEDVLEDILWELEIGLLESDVALPVVEAIKGNVKEQLLSMSVGGKSPGDVVEKVLRSAIKRVLSTQTFNFDAFIEEKLAAGKRPITVMFVGVNGTGKTTSIGRLAYRLQQQGRSVVLAAGDTFRAGAIQQLQQHGDKLGVKVVAHNSGADPAAVAYDAIEHAKARKKDVILLDTAGRMQTNTNLMDEMDKIRRVASPDLTIFVGDSLAGNDAVEQARKFDEVVDIDGAILTKTDVDAKGGAALSVAYTINKPLMFVGVGQNYPDLKAFDAEWLVDRLFADE
ncbi:MAG: signal recognition particle-docking protein FtsY [Thermoplasmatota archaeon]